MQESGARIQEREKQKRKDIEKRRVRIDSDIEVALGEILNTLWELRRKRTALSIRFSPVFCP
jgi:hypothetical protein